MSKIIGIEIIEDSQTALAQVAAKTGSNITSEEAAKNTSLSEKDRKDTC